MHRNWMDDDMFDAARFLEQLDRGTFDGHLQEVLPKLTCRQLQEVAELMAARLKLKKDSGTAN